MLQIPNDPGAPLDCGEHPSNLQVVFLASMQQLPPEALEHVAHYFRTLSEATRLRILNVLGHGEMSVGDIAEKVDSSVANVSRHLAQMAQHGLVARESRGNSAYYRIADPAVHQLCDLVCGNIARRFEDVANTRAAFVRTTRAKPTTGR